MNIVKALVGGLVGGGLGAVASNYAQPLFKEPNPWTLILAGLFAGLGVRVLCGRNRDFLTGVLATVAAILAIGGASYWVSLSTIRAMETANAAIDSQTPSMAELLAKDDSEEETDEEASDDVAAPIVDEAPVDMDELGPEPEVDMNKSLYSKEAIANVLAALLAFVLGTGSPATVGDESQDATGDVDEHA
jgi:hypothetical protein